MLPAVTPQTLDFLQRNGLRLALVLEASESIVGHRHLHSDRDPRIPQFHAQDRELVLHVQDAMCPPGLLHMVLTPVHHSLHVWVGADQLSYQMEYRLMRSPFEPTWQLGPIDDPLRESRGAYTTGPGPAGAARTPTPFSSAREHDIYTWISRSLHELGTPRHADRAPAATAERLTGVLEARDMLLAGHTEKHRAWIAGLRPHPALRVVRPPESAVGGAARQLESASPALGSDSAGIRTFLAGRGVTAVYHFTPVENLASIAARGLCNRATIDRLRLAGNAVTCPDEDRHDGARWAICCSIQWPNHKMLFHKMQEGLEFAVLELSPRVLWELSCLFFPVNAANGALKGLIPQYRDGVPPRLEQLRRLYPASDEDPRRGQWRAYPKNVQAEVLVDAASIDLSYCTQIHVRDAPHLQKIRGLRWPYQVASTVTPELFGRFRDRAAECEDVFPTDVWEVDNPF